MEGKGRDAGQAMIEFALTLFVFFLALFAVVTAGIYTTERSAAVGAAAASARIAAGGVDSGLVGAGDDPASRSLVRAAATRRAAELLAPAAFGNSISIVDGDCSHIVVAPGRVYVCAYDDPGPDPTVTVRIHGRTSLLLPDALGFLTGFPIDVHATIHRLTFSG
ncbi:MAG: TadE family protein [Candidatus Dormibacteria bacterium]